MNRAVLGMKSVVGTAAICVLLSLLSIAGYSGLLGARSISGQPLPVSTSIAAGPLAWATLSDRLAPDSTRDDSYAAAELSTYMFFHQTWHRAISAPVTPNTCPDHP